MSAWSQFDEKTGVVAAFNALPELIRKNVVRLDWSHVGSPWHLLAETRDGRRWYWDGVGWQ